MDGARIVMAAAVMVMGCAASPASVASSSSPVGISPSPQIDQSGNALPPRVDDATWARLAARPLALPSLARGAACPKSPTANASPFTGPLAGPGPVYAA